MSDAFEKAIPAATERPQRAEQTKKLVKVYDLQGVEHEMTYENARDMITHAGWRRQQFYKAPDVEVIYHPPQPKSVDDKVKVFDPDGVEHEMTWGNARDLIAHRGWTRQRLASTVPPAPVSEPAAEQTDQSEPPQQVTEAATAEPTAAPSEPTQPVDKAEEPASVTLNFDEMSVEAVAEYAKSLGIKVDGRWSKARTIAAIREASEEEAAE
jgi:hypothetical protein